MLSRKNQPKWTHNCVDCAIGGATEHLVNAASLGRVLHAARKLVLNMWPRGDGTHKRARNGMHRGNQLGLRANCSRNKSSRYLRIFQQLRFDHESASRVGMQARSGKATAPTRGIGRRWRNWLVSIRARKDEIRGAIGQRELRRRGIGQHTIEKALRSLVRLRTYRKILSAIEQYKRDHHNG